MKNTLKRISAIAMAFTLLGTGTAVTKHIAPQNCNSSITAYAANYTKNYETYKKYKPTEAQLRGHALKVNGNNNRNSVKWLQAALNHLMNAHLDVDGIHGNKTKSAVIDFQRFYKLETDGKFGVKSLAKMNKILKHTTNKKDPKRNCKVCGYACR